DTAHRTTTTGRCVRTANAGHPLQHALSALWTAHRVDLDAAAAAVPRQRHGRRRGPGPALARAPGDQPRAGAVRPAAPRRLRGAHPADRAARRLATGQALAAAPLRLPRRAVHHRAVHRHRAALDGHQPGRRLRGRRPAGGAADARPPEHRGLRVARAARKGPGPDEPPEPGPTSGTQSSSLPGAPLATCIKNSMLVEVLRNRSCSSSSACWLSSAASTRRSLWVTASSSGDSRISSRRVLEASTWTAGNSRLSASLRSSFSSALPVPLNSSKMTVSMVEPVSTRAVAKIVSEPPFSMLRAAPRNRFGGYSAVVSTPPDRIHPDAGADKL